MRATGKRAILLLTFLTLVATPGAGQSVRSATSSAPAADNRLMQGDAIRLAFSDRRDLNADYSVDEVGNVMLPLLGSRKVIGVPPAELKRLIAEEYGRQFRNEVVQIIPLHRVEVLGPVKNPGLYYVDATMTLRDAVAMAGGVTTEGKQGNVRLFRRGQELKSDLRSGRGIGHLESGDVIFVSQRSWLSRNGHFVLGATISALGFVLSQAVF